MSAQNNWQVRRLAGSLGAEITGLDLNEIAAGDEAGIEAVMAQLLEHQVIFFPGQKIDIDSHVALGKRFGKVENHPNLKNPFTQHDEVFELAATQGGVADEWHTDITFEDQPSIMSILHMVTCPEFGGDTMWTNLNQAYQELSPPMRALCDGLTALHDAHPHNREDKMAVHPVVRVHPETGAKALYVNEHFTRRLVEMNATESKAVLEYLTSWVKNPRFTVRYHWTPGTIAIWDNRCTQHFVLNDFEGERIIQRVTVMGDIVEPAQPSPWESWVRPGRLSATTRLDRQLNRYMKNKAAESADS